MDSDKIKKLDKEIEKCIEKEGLTLTDLLDYEKIKEVETDKLEKVFGEIGKCIENNDMSVSEFLDDEKQDKSFLSQLLRPTKSKGMKIKTEMPKPSWSYNPYNKVSIFNMTGIWLSDESVKKFNDIILQMLSGNEPLESPISCPNFMLYNKRQMKNKTGLDFSDESLKRINELFVEAKFNTKN